MNSSILVTLHPDSIETAIYKNQYKCERYIKKGLTCEGSPWTEKDGVVYWKELLYVPNEQTIREYILRESYDHPTTGHPGIQCTRDLIVEKYYWPTIWWDIETYIKGCDCCQKTKPKTTSSQTPLLQYEDQTSSFPLSICPHCFLTVHLHLPFQLCSSQMTINTPYGSSSFLTAFYSLSFPSTLNALLLQ